MKKFTNFVLAALLVLAPLSASALEALTDSNMNSVTGQAGVSIAVDDIVLVQKIGKVSYTDSDSGASLFISDREVVKTINAITGDATIDADLQADYKTANAANWTGAHALSIDIGKCDILSRGIAANMGVPAAAVTVAGVIIGLPTVEIHTSADTFNVGIDMTGAANDGKEFITITKEASTLAILGGTLEIAPH